MDASEKSIHENASKRNAVVSHGLLQYPSALAIHEVIV